MNCSRTRLHKTRHRLTVLAVDSIEAWLALADVLVEDIASTGMTGQLAGGIILARVWVTRPFWTGRMPHRRRDKCNRVVVVMSSINS